MCDEISNFFLIFESTTTTSTTVLFLVEWMTQFLCLSDYIRGVFPDLADPALMYSQFSAGFKHHGHKVVQIFKRFRARFPPGPITPDHLTAFMLYRVAGEGNEDAYSGSISLCAFFSNNLYPLMRYLEMTGEVTFEISDVLKDPEFKKQHKMIARFLENATHAQSRVIWFQDELQLRRCFNHDTASKRDEAALVLMLRSGFRPESIAQIDLWTDVTIEGDGTVVLILPKVKTNHGRDFYFPLIEDDAAVMRRWIHHRKRLNFNSRLLFINKNGKEICTNDITMMLKKLCRMAGYGEGFFTASSLRRSYANRCAARVFARDGGVMDAARVLADGCRWHIRSKVAQKYVDNNIATFFQGGRNLSWDEFTALPPHVMHSLPERLPDPRIRPITWLHHPDSWVEEVCQSLRVSLDSTPFLTRLRIGVELMRRDIRLYDLLREAVRISPKSVNMLISDTAGCLMEDRVIQLDRWMSPDARVRLLEAVSVKSYGGPKVLKASRALQTVVYPLWNRAQAIRQMAKVLKRKYDRKLYLGRLPSGTMVLMRVHMNEVNCQEAQQPRLDIDLHFPDTPVTRPPNNCGRLDLNTPSTVGSTPLDRAQASQSSARPCISPRTLF